LWTRRYAGILVAVFLASTASGLNRPSIAYFVRYTLHGSVLAAAGLTSGFMTGRALASVLGGFLGDLSRRIRWILASTPVFFASLIAYTIPSMDSVGAILVLMGLWGLLAGFTWPSVQTITAHLAKPRSNTALSIYFAIGTVGIAFGNKLFGLLHASYAAMIRWSSVLMFLAGVTLLISTIGVETPEAGGRRLARNIARAARHGLIVWVLVAAFTVGMLSGLMREYFYIYAHEIFGTTKQDLGNILLLTGLAGAAVGLVAGRLGDIRGLPIALTSVLLGAALGGIGIGMASGLWSLLAFYLLAGASSRASMPLTRNATLVEGAGGGAIVGLSNAINNLGMIVGPMIGGALYGYKPLGPRLPYIIVGALLVLVAIGYWLVRPRQGGKVVVVGA